MEIAHHDVIIAVSAEALENGSIEVRIRRDDRNRTTFHYRVSQASVRRMFELIESKREMYLVRGGFNESGGRMLLYLQEKCWTTLEMERFNVEQNAA
jgi:hypothetical protein